MALWSTLQFDSGVCSVIPTVCREPPVEELQSRFEALNNNLNIKSLFIQDGWNEDTLESVFNNLVTFTNSNKENGVCPLKYPKDDIPLNLRSSCPWFPVEDVDNSRYPSVLYTAKTHCTSGCIGTNGHQRCESLYRTLKVLSRDGCANGVYQYRTVDVSVSIAYICAQQREVQQNEDTALLSG